MENKNYISAEIYINEEDINQDIRIINSYENLIKEEGIFVEKLCEEFVENYSQKKEEVEYKEKEKEKTRKYKNEEEIKEKCKIIINDIIIPFTYYLKFTKKGKYNIKYLFTENLKHADYLFYRCGSLTNIDLSNFNTQNINNMSSMFLGCYSLTNINLSNFNAKNVTNMDFMFSGCKSLKNINLSDFNTQNVTDMNSMFMACYSLINLNLSNFNT